MKYLAKSGFTTVDPSASNLILGEPLIFKAMELIMGKTPPPGMEINLHPIGFAAWFAWSQIELTRTSTRSCAAPQHCPNDRGIDVPSWLMIYTSDRAKIGRAIAPCVRGDDFAILGGAGSLPYYARLRGIDVYGLVSERIAHDEPRVNARPGHTKWGNPQLLADYDPTFVMHCYAIHAQLPGPTSPCGEAGFWLARGYEPVTLHVPELEEMGTYYTFLAKKARRELAHEALGVVRPGSFRKDDDLQGDGALETRVERLVDLPHPALA